MKKEQVSYYPVFLNLSGKKCVVVGGGKVAGRKVGALLECGAEVTVVSPELCEELKGLVEAGEITAAVRPYRSGDLKGSAVVIAATGTRSVNVEIVNEARKRGIPVNVVDDPDYSDFIVPSCLKRGDITIAVSTSGKSPALARKIRENLEKNIGGEYAALALLTAEVRTDIKKRGIVVSSEDWQRALDIDLLVDLLRKNEREKAKNILLASLKVPQI